MSWIRRKSLRNSIKGIVPSAGIGRIAGQVEETRARAPLVRRKIEGLGQIEGPARPSSREIADRDLLAPQGSAALKIVLVAPALLVIARQATVVSAREIAINVKIGSASRVAKKTVSAVHRSMSSLT